MSYVSFSQQKFGTGAALVPYWDMFGMIMLCCYWLASTKTILDLYWPNTGQVQCRCNGPVLREHVMCIMPIRASQLSNARSQYRRYTKISAWVNVCVVCYSIKVTQFHPHKHKTEWLPFQNIVWGNVRSVSTK